MHHIVSACGTATYNTAKFITKILQNHCGKISSFVKDSTDFIKNIKHLSINPEEEILVSFDVSALFTSIPVLLHYKLSIPIFLPAPISPMSARSLQKNSSSFWNSLTSIASSASIRNFINNDIGFSISPVTTNTYMEHFESLDIPTSPTIIKWWFSYVDDVHSTTRKNQVTKLQEHLNSIDPHIKFTIELPGTDGLPFIDTMTKSTPYSIESTVHRNPTHTERYLDYNTNYPITAKLYVFHTLIHRAKQECSALNFLQNK